MTSQRLPDQDSQRVTLVPEQTLGESFCCDQSLNPVDFVSRVRIFGLELLQIDRGKFSARGSQARFGKVLLGCADFARATVQTWKSPARSRTLAVKTTGEAVLWRGLELQHCDVLVVGPNIEVELVSMAGSGIAAVTFLDSAYEDWAGVCDLVPPGDNAVLMRAQSRLPVDELSMAIVTLLSQASARAEAEWGSGGREELLRLSLSAVSKGVAVEPQNHGVRRLRALEFALSAIRSDCESRLNVPTLCRMAGVSERTLHNAFIDRYTVPPARFMKAYRLNRLRQELAGMASHRLPIAQIANHWGFWHLGQLARDYRTWFGELPSATYRRTVAQVDAGGIH
jgi:AraC-like DNA-binding protein